MTDEEAMRLTRDAQVLRDSPVFAELFVVARERVIRALEEADNLSDREDLAAELRALKRVRTVIGALIAPGEAVSRNRSMRVS